MSRALMYKVSTPTVFTCLVHQSLVFVFWQILQIPICGPHWISRLINGSFILLLMFADMLLTYDIVASIAINRTAVSFVRGSIVLAWVVLLLLTMRVSVYWFVAGCWYFSTQLLVMAYPRVLPFKLVDVDWLLAMIALCAIVFSASVFFGMLCD